MAWLFSAWGRIASLLIFVAALGSLGTQAQAQPAPGIFVREVSPGVAQDGQVERGRTGPRVFAAHIADLPDGRRVFYESGEVTVPTPPISGASLSGGAVVVSGDEIQWQAVYRYDPDRDLNPVKLPRPVYEEVNRRGIVLRAALRFSPDGATFSGFEQTVSVNHRDGRLENVVVYTAPVSGRRIPTQTTFTLGKNQGPSASVSFGQSFVLGAAGPRGQRVDAPARIGLFREGDNTLPGFGGDRPREWNGALLADPADPWWAASGFQLEFQQAPAGQEPRLEINQARRTIIAHWAPGWVLRGARIEGGAVEIRPAAAALRPNVAEGETPCAITALSAAPASAPSGQTVTLTIGYAPAGCARRRLPEPEWQVTPSGGLAAGAVYVEDSANNDSQTFEARAPGNYQVRVRQGNLTASTPVTVLAGAPCRDYTVEEASGRALQVVQGQQRELRAFLTQNGCMKPAAWESALRRWTSSDPAKATVTPDGLVTAIAPGPVTITYERAGLTGRIALQVVPPPACTSMALRYSTREVAVRGVAGRPELQLGGRLL